MRLSATIQATQFLLGRNRKYFHEKSDFLYFDFFSS